MINYHYRRILLMVMIQRELYQKQKDNAHRNVLDILNSDDKDYQEVLKQFQSVEPWFDATGEFSAQYEADLARLGASTPKLVPYMKQIASLIQVYKKAWYEADNEMQQTLDDALLVVLTRYMQLELIR